MEFGDSARLPEVLRRLTTARRLLTIVSDNPALDAPRNAAYERLTRVYMGGGVPYLYPSTEETAASPSVRPERLNATSLDAIVAAAEAVITEQGITTSALPSDPAPAPSCGYYY